MIFREASVLDIPQLHQVRMAVRENILNNPLLVTEMDYQRYLTKEGKGWVCEIDGRIAGFAIIDIIQRNIWALFVEPDFQSMGVGKNLQKFMLDWYFSGATEKLWLSTAPNTRAALFYRMSGWKETGKTTHGELRFEMEYDDWKKK
jgi:GNAT superfamily N-acetyltransferase